MKQQHRRSPRSEPAASRARADPPRRKRRRAAIAERAEPQASRPASGERDGGQPAGARDASQSSGAASPAGASSAVSMTGSGFQDGPAPVSRSRPTSSRPRPATPRVIDRREGEQQREQRHGGNPRAPPAQARSGMCRSAGLGSPNPATRSLTNAPPCRSAALSALVGACGCATAEPGGADEPETEGITVYSGRIPAPIGPVVDKYEADADRDVQVRFGDTAARRDARRGGRNSPADVFFSQEPARSDAVDAEGLLAAAATRSSIGCRPRSAPEGLGRDHRPGPGARLQPRRGRVRAARLAARAHRAGVGGPGRLGADERLAAGLHHCAAPGRGRRGGARVARGHGRQRPGL